MLDLVEDNGTYLDIGANHPFLISNTYLLYLKGWRGVTVEPIRSLWQMHRRWRPEDVSLNVAVGQKGAMLFYELYPDVLSTASREVANAIEADGNGTIVDEYEVPIISGNSIMEKHFAGRELTLLSIDVEGMDFEVLKSFDFTEHRPRYVLLEHSNFVPNEQGASDSAAYLAANYYVFDREIGCNSLFKSAR
tara:strand:+ start:1642 stop:2217 length:576 start_codon:yes stop_codon:yes gene_type:complete